jgi:hypothetical protein
MKTTLQQRIAGRPNANEYAPYYERYVSLVGGEDIEQILAAQAPDSITLFSRFSEEKGEFRYAPGKWSVKEVIGHLTDSERVFAYRALRIARADQTPLEGFEQDDYVKNGPFSQISVAALIEEFAHVRSATTSLFRNLTGEEWSRRGVANKVEVTVRGLAFIIAGHELHHRKILEERYLTK